MNKYNTCYIQLEKKIKGHEYNKTKNLNRKKIKNHE